MRGVTAVLVLFLAACSTAGGDTTTTAPLAKPSTTIATVPSTTTTEPTTTTTEEECVDRDGDGVLRNRRGFICPPTMHTYTGTSINLQDLPQQYLPGSYTTRSVEPAFTFNRSTVFRSIGESPGFSIGLDSNPGNDQALRFVEAFDTIPSTGFAEVNWASLEWASDLEIQEDSIGGFEATVVDFVLPEDAPCNIVCTLDIGLGESWGWNFPQHVRLVILNVEGGPMAINIQAHPDRFDTYWTEVAQPILDSIEFLDP